MKGFEIVKKFFLAITAFFLLAACGGIDTVGPETHFMPEDEMRADLFADEPMPESDELPVPAMTPAPTIPPYLPQPDELGFVVGATVPFGGRSWRVLEVDGRYALLLHETVIEGVYHYMEEEVTWEESSAREWLNGTFFHRFSGADARLIRETLLINNDNPWTYYQVVRGLGQAPGGANTTDRIFLLSLDEVVRYFGGAELLELGRDESNRDGSIPGLYGRSIWEDDENSVARIAFNETGQPSQWWLRSPGFTSFHAVSVAQDGSISVIGSSVNHSGTREGFPGLRPALWLNLKYMILG